MISSVPRRKISGDHMRQRHTRLWGSKPSIPAWAAHALRAEWTWRAQVFTLLMGTTTSYTAFESDGETLILVACLAAPFIYLLSKSLTRIGLKLATQYTFKHIGPPPFSLHHSFAYKDYENDFESTTHPYDDAITLDIKVKATWDDQKNQCKRLHHN